MPKMVSEPFRWVPFTPLSLFRVFSFRRSSSGGWRSSGRSAPVWFAMLRTSERNSIRSKSVNQTAYKKQFTNRFVFFRVIQILHSCAGRHSARSGRRTDVGIQSHLLDASRSSVRQDHRSGGGRDYRAILRLLLLGLANGRTLGQLGVQPGAVERRPRRRQRRRQRIPLGVGAVAVRCQLLCVGLVGER